MGLDMFLYRVKKIEGISPNEKIERKDFNARFPNAATIPIDDDDCKLRTIKKVGIPITIIENVYDAKLVGESCGIENVKTISKCYEGFKGNNHTIKFICYDADGNRLGEATIQGEEHRKKCTHPKEFDYLVFNKEEIDYQRKGLNNKGWDLLPPNCKCCDKKTLVRKLTQGCGLSKSFLYNWEDGQTIFVAWW